MTTLIDVTAEDTGASEAATAATLKAALKFICRSVARGNTVQLENFGTFKAVHLSDKEQRNPQAGDPVNEVGVVEFLPAEAFRKLVNHR